MSILSFAKYAGAGNDFILVDDRDGSFPFSDISLIQKICNTSAVDGLILLQLDPSADFRMRIFNLDGSEAASCGNGLRCLARFIQDLNFPKKNYKIAIAKGFVKVCFEGDLIGVDMGTPTKLELHIPTPLGSIHFIDTGVPHIVHFVSNVEQSDLSFLGPYFRHYPRFFPQGANVNIVSFNLNGNLFVRTFERGVEGETLSCGTGAAAVAVIAKKVYNVSLPVTLHFKGGELVVDEKKERISLIGSAILTN
jgi:diaminopimelate epimerase